MCSPGFLAVRLSLAGYPAQAGRSGVPVVDHGRPGHVVVERPALALEHDAEEADAERQEGQPQPERAQDGLAGS